MAQLSISLIGPFQAMLDGEPLQSFESDKERALLAYLAAERERVHTRETLSELLWPARPSGNALSNLRHTLSCLRKTIGDTHAEPPFLRVTRKTIQLNADADVSVDLASLDALADGLRSAADQAHVDALLRRGLLLDGFALDDCPEFEAWIVLKREQTTHKIAAVLAILVAACCRDGDYGGAVEWAEQRAALQPWNEESHQQLIWLLARDGQQAAALRQYETCRAMLAESFDVDPQPETTALVEAIRNGSVLQAGLPGPAIHSSTADDGTPASVYTPAQRNPPLFARGNELKRLAEALERTRAGRGQVVLFAGEPGSGKTALLRAFVRRAGSIQREMTVCLGRCTAYSGMGDPFLPFREVLSQLLGLSTESTGDNAATARYRSEIDLPRLLPVLVWECPDLVGTLVSGPSLIKRTAAIEDEEDRWRSRLERLLAHRAEDLSDQNRLTNVLPQFAAIVRAAAQRMPLVLAIDDLQWADAPSIELLFHLCRTLENAPVLILGAFRPGDVALGRMADEEWRRHPLETVLNELRLSRGDIVIDLDESNRRQGRDFVDAVIDSEPNRLPEDFRAAVYQRTNGHPLFTVELIRSLHIAGSLYQDKDGQWTVDKAVNWRTMPPRIDAMLAERFDRLDLEARAMLAIACVEGEVFTLDVVEQIQTMDRRTLLHRVSDELWRRHGIVRPESMVMNAGEPVRYRFEHVLFQQYLYDRLSPGERALLHGEIGTAMARIHGADNEDYAGQLAHHFVEAGNVEHAVPCLLIAGRRAVRVSAYQEAIRLLEQGLALLAALPESPKRDELELSLQTNYGVARASAYGYADAGAGRAFLRAELLSHGVEPTIQHVAMLVGLVAHLRATARYVEAQKRGEQLLSLASKLANPRVTAYARISVGQTELFLADYASARTHIEEACRDTQFGEHQIDDDLLIADPIADGLPTLSHVLCALGYPDQAMEKSEQGLALAEKAEHPPLLAYALENASELRAWRCEWRIAVEMAEATMAHANHHGLPFWRAYGLVNRGWALLELGEIEAGAQAVEEANRFFDSAGIRIGATQSLGHLALAYGLQGNPEGGHRLLDRALALAYETGEHWWTSELLRTRGRLLTDTNHEQAEASFRASAAFARERQAKFFELKATLDLSRLLINDGRTEEVALLLSPLVEWFTEGFETRDIKEAMAMLKACS